MLQLSSVQLFSHVQLFASPWTSARQASLSITNSQSLLKLISTESLMPSNHFILFFPLLLLPSVIPSSRGFANEPVFLHQMAKHWSSSFSISLSIEYSGLFSYRMDHLDLLTVQGTLKSLPHYSPKVLSFLYIPVLTSIHDYWKNHSFD